MAAWCIHRKRLPCWRERRCRGASGGQPSRLQNLDDLLAQAEHYAESCMRNIGRLRPTPVSDRLEGSGDVHARIAC
jgi:hypothetical protein